MHRERNIDICIQIRWYLLLKITQYQKENYLYMVIIEKER